MSEHSLVEIYPIRPHLWALDEVRKTTMYVYEGTDRVLLIDTGFGLSDLKKIVGGLCPGKEILVVNTHGHGDHNGGNNQFDTVYVGRMDEPFSHSTPTPETRQRFISTFFTQSEFAAQIDPNRWNPGPCEKVLPLRDGDVLSLGGIDIEVLETPGHSLGSISLLDRANGLLFTGDLMLTWQVWGQLEYSTTLKDYGRSLERLATLEDQITEVFPAHGRSDNPHGWPIYHLPPRVLSVYADGVRSILEGESVGTPFHDGPEGLVVYFDIGGMVYNPRRLGIK